MLTSYIFYCTYSNPELGGSKGSSSGGKGGSKSGYSSSGKGGSTDPSKSSHSSGGGGGSTGNSSSATKPADYIMAVLKEDNKVRQ